MTLKQVSTTRMIQETTARILLDLDFWSIGVQVGIPAAFILFQCPSVWG